MSQWKAAKVYIIITHLFFISRNCAPPSLKSFIATKATRKTTSARHTAPNSWVSVIQFLPTKAMYTNYHYHQKSQSAQIKFIF